MSTPALISIDWGTTSMRGALIARDGSILDRRDTEHGILAVSPGGFASELALATDGWRSCDGAVPCLMSGMIGSRQGWQEVPYLPCPAAAVELGAALQPLSTGSGATFIVPGVLTRTSDGTPDVMRGEETQIIGALAAANDPSGLFVLPGTHSKWATTRNGVITGFTTYMTGEVFAAVRGHTILGRLMPAAPSEFDAVAFDRGVSVGAAAGHPGQLLHRLFSARTLGLFDEVPPSGLEHYLSGLLIGAEIAAAANPGAAKTAAMTIIGSAVLCDRYHRAASHLGLTATSAPPDCAAHGHFLLAEAAGLLKGP